MVNQLRRQAGDKTLITAWGEYFADGCNGELYTEEEGGRAYIPRNHNGKPLGLFVINDDIEPLLVLPPAAVM